MTKFKSVKSSYINNNLYFMIYIKCCSATLLRAIPHNIYSHVHSYYTMPVTQNWICYKWDYVQNICLRRAINSAGSLIGTQYWCWLMFIDGLT